MKCSFICSPVPSISSPSVARLQIAGVCRACGRDGVKMWEKAICQTPGGAQTDEKVMKRIKQHFTKNWFQVEECRWRVVRLFWDCFFPDTQVENNCTIINARIFELRCNTKRISDSIWHDGDCCVTGPSESCGGGSHCCDGWRRRRRRRRWRSAWRRQSHSFAKSSGRLDSLDHRPHQSRDVSTGANSICAQTCMHMCTD